MKNFIASILFVFLATCVAMAQEPQFKLFESEIIDSNVDEIETLADQPTLGSSNQQALNMMNVELLKQAGKANSSVPIVIISTGNDPNHGDFNGRLRNDLYRDTITGGGIQDQSGVGTAVNGTIAGLKYSATDNKFVVNIRAFDNNAGTLQSVLAALDYAYSVIQASGGKGLVFAHFYTTQQIVEFESKIREGLNRGIVIVTPAGDFDPGKQVAVYPAAYNGVISVGAVDANRQKTNFTGSGVVYAPGTNIITTQKGGGTVTLNGTSQAGTFVADLVAAFMTHFPNSNVYQSVLNSLEGGIIDAKKLFGLQDNIRPLARFDVISLGFAGNESVFNISGSDSQNRRLFFLIDFDDFTGVQRVENAGVVRHTFVKPGNYNVRLQAVAGELGSEIVTTQITILDNPVTNRPPMINVAREFNASVNEDIRISGTVTDPDGDAVRVFFEKSDRKGEFEEVGASFNVVRNFPNPGTFFLIVEAKDSKGLAIQQSVRFNIKDRPKQILSGSATFDPSINRLTVKANVSGPQTLVSVAVFDGEFPLKPKVNNEGSFLYRGKFRTSIKPKTVRIFLQTGEQLVITVLDK